MPIQGPQWSEFLSCPVCYNGFSKCGREPITLGCGHSICTSCLSRLSKQSCPFDQTEVKKNISDLPINYALLQLVGEKPPDTLHINIPEVEENHSAFEGARKCIECLGQFLAPLVNSTRSDGAPGATSSISSESPVRSTISTTITSANNCNASGGVLTRPMQRKLVTLVNCQLAEEEGRCRALRAARSLGERAVKELILLHQNPQKLSGNLWSAVRSRGCQFLGPAMQEEVLRLILLALEEGNSLCRKVLVLYVVQKLENDFAQASKTSIGHVVQLLYRASCFKVTKREGDSSLLQLQERYRTYSALRKEHDAQIVQIAMEAGLHISPEQWSALLYGDDTHKSHMQSIIDKLQSPASFGSSIQELIIALQRTGDPANLQQLRTHLELLAKIDPNPEGPPPSWSELHESMEALQTVVYGLVEFVKDHSAKVKGSIEQQNPANNKYKTHMCRDILKKGACPRGSSCTFAHTNEELERFGRRRKTTGTKIRGTFVSNRTGSSPSPETVEICDKRSSQEFDTSNSDRECSDTLPDEGASGIRPVPHDPQPGLLLQEVQNGIRTMCNPTQYPVTANGTYAPSYTYSATVDRNPVMPSSIGYLPNVTLHGAALGNGALASAYYTPTQPPPLLNGLGGSFGRPQQIPSPAMAQPLTVNRGLYLNGQPDVRFYDTTRQRSNNFSTPGYNNAFIPQYQCVDNERYGIVPQYDDRVPYNQGVNMYSDEGVPDAFGNFPNSYYPPDNGAKGGRLPDGPSPSTNTGTSVPLKTNRFSDDLKSKGGWQHTESKGDTINKSEFVAKFSKLHSLGSCADTSYSSYDCFSDTFSPTSSGSSHQGSPPSQHTEYDKIWQPCVGMQTREKGVNEHSWRHQGVRWPDYRKPYGSAFWQQTQGGNRLQQSYDEDSFTGLNRSLQEDPSNTSCDSSVPSLPDASSLDKEESNRSYDQSPFGLGLVKQQGLKNSDGGASYWNVNEQSQTTQLDEDLNFLQRNNQNSHQKLLPPPGMKPIGFIGDRRGPMTSSEINQGSNEQSHTDTCSGLGNILRGTRRQQVDGKYGNFSDLTVRE